MPRKKKETPQSPAAHGSSPGAEAQDPEIPQLRELLLDGLARLQHIEQHVCPEQAPEVDQDHDDAEDNDDALIDMIENAARVLTEEERVERIAGFANAFELTGDEMEHLVQSIGLHAISIVNSSLDEEHGEGTVPHVLSGMVHYMLNQKLGHNGSDHD